MDRFIVEVPAIMRPMRIAAAVLLATVMAVAEARPPTLDGSSKDSFDSSLQAMRQTLSNKENCLLSAAFVRIQVAEKIRLVEETGDQEAVPTPLEAKLDGFTYKQVLKLASKQDAPVMAMCRD